MGLFSALKNGIQKASENIEKNQEVKNKKNKILKRFSLRQLQYMAKNYGIKVEPASIAGVIEKRKPNVDDYMYCIRNKLSYEEILDYGKKRNIDLSDIIEEEKGKKSAAIKEIYSASVNIETSETETQLEVLNTYDDIRQKIESFELDFAVNSEDEFEKHLYQFLKFNFPNFQIDRQVPCGDGSDRVDLVVSSSELDLDIGIELKLGTNKNHLRNARAQVEDYSKFFDYTMLVILDIGNVDLAVYDDIVNKVKKYDVDTLILEGQLTQRKSNEMKRKEKIIKELIK